jgi:transglutaminase-like putative cysteine protease
VIAGTVYVDDAFLYHAWNEVWLGDAWVSVDTTMDQMPADASHVKLLEGGPETHATLLPLLGNLAVDVVASN